MRPQHTEQAAEGLPLSSLPCSSYLTLKQAAHYCGYSVRQFRRHISTYALPGKGPEKNKFRREDLDCWMENPCAFQKSIRSRNGKGFTKVAA